MGKLALDTYVIMDYLSGNERMSGKAESYLKHAKTAEIVISTVSLSEMFYHIAKRGSRSEAMEAVFFLTNIEGIKFKEPTIKICIKAAEVKLNWYSKNRPLSFIDCINLAMAIEERCDKFVTGDMDFKGIDENIEIEVYK